MIEDLNKTVLEKILTKIPEHLKPVNYLMDILDLGKESAYRRLRGEKAFSFNELSKLSENLGFSLDELIQKKNTKTAIFNYVGSFGSKTEEGILEFFLYYESYLNQISKDENTKITITMNRLLYTMILRHEHLFKFAYYRWMHQMKEVSLNFTYADTVIDSRILEIRNRIREREHLIKNVSYIIDKNIFLNLIREIQYFYKRGLLQSDELELIKKDFFTFLGEIEKTLNSGIDRSGNISEIYLSILNIDSNTTYAISDGKIESSFWLCYGHPIKTTNIEITSRHKYWIDSLKKYSTMITSSNELIQADFFNQQREYLNNITEENWL